MLKIDGLETANQEPVLEPVLKIEGLETVNQELVLEMESVQARLREKENELN